MEEDQDSKGQEGIDPAGAEGRAVISDDYGVVADPDDAKDEQDHEGAESPKRRAELEHVPRHDHWPRSVHRLLPPQIARRRQELAKSGGEVRDPLAPLSWLLPSPSPFPFPFRSILFDTIPGFYRKQSTTYSTQVLV
ncbi:hypothetical protein GW17_00036386 [Ensete ventricosum]|nr:hypothetical protein GW17_00036386 [Ensete ventricosum]